MMAKGLRISVALEDSSKAIELLGEKDAKFKETITLGNFPVGLIEYVPIEHALEPVRGNGSLFINCMWVLRPFWRHGVARALVQRAVEMGKNYGGVSILAYDGDKWLGGYAYLPAAQFRKMGFKDVDRDGSRVLLHLNTGSNEKPELVHPQCKKYKGSGKPVVDIYFNSQCLWSGWSADEVRRNIGKYKVEANFINTDDRQVVLERGLSRGVCINGEPLVKRIAPWWEIEPLIRKAIRD
ncbi:MAG: GNAT family N-acetyltransferase [Candidatus Atabeyarchaeum deiterrae]